MPAQTPCSVTSLDLGEPLAGTAATTPAWVLVEQPAPWGRLGAEDSPHPSHPSALAELAARAGRLGVRVQLLRRPAVRGARDRSTDAPWRPTVVLAATDATGGRAVTSVVEPDALARLPLEELVEGVLPTGWEAVEALWAACTHGRRDACCAREGRGLAAALQQQTTDPVWETTHLGGHRFAPTVLRLPEGLVYGRVPLDRVADLVEAHATDRTVPDLLRGRTALAPWEQVAEVSLRRHLRLDGADVRLQSSSPPTPVADGVTRSRTHWAVPGGVWRVVVDAGPAEPRPVSCGADPTRPVAHTVVEVASVEDAGHGADGWDVRHTDPEHVAGPDPRVMQAVEGASPGRALDVAAGRGRHSLALARAGWDVTAVDFSRVGLETLRQQADGLRVRTVLGDARVWEPADDERFDLVLLSFVHVPGVTARAARWLAPGGRLVLVGHARRNLTEGVGGPSDVRLLHDAQALRDAATAAGLRVERAEEVERPMDEGTAFDVVLVAVRPRDQA